MNTYSRKTQKPRPYNPHEDTTLINTQKVLDFIRAYSKKYGICPSMRQMAEHIGYGERSWGNITPMLRTLVDQHFLIREGNGARSYRVHPNPPRPYFYKRKKDNTTPTQPENMK